MTLEIRISAVLRGLTGVLCALGLVLASAPAAFASTTPVVKSVTPAEGSVKGGTKVTISGESFETTTGGTEVFFGGKSGSGGVAATKVNVVDGTTIEAETPAHAEGPVEVCVLQSLTFEGCKPAVFKYQPEPVVTSVSPAEGPEKGGIGVVVHGEHLEGATVVKFGEVAGTALVPGPNPSEELGVITPAHPKGLVSVCVTTPGGTRCADVFTYRSAPTVTGITPDEGPVEGGTEVTLTGTEFEAGNTTVKFVGAKSTTGLSGARVHVESSTTLKLTTPGEVAGAATVSVTTGQGESTSSATFTFREAPTVSAISPVEGSVKGGTSVTITGTHFVGTPLKVKFGGEEAASVVVESETQITAVTAPTFKEAVAKVHVFVEEPGGSAQSTAEFSFRAAPTITEIIPAEGPVTGGTKVVIKGTDLGGETESDPRVEFEEGKTASVTYISETEIEATAPPIGFPAAVPVIVSTVGGTAQSTADFSYRGAPGISAITPAEGPATGGTKVLITGANLGGETGTAPKVEFGAGHPASGVTLKSETELEATTAAAAGAEKVHVIVTTVGGKAESGEEFSFRAAPTITEISPTEGPAKGGTTVIIKGSDLGGEIAVKPIVEFGAGSVAASVTYKSETEIEATTAPTLGGRAESVHVVVRAPFGEADSAQPFAFRGAPTVSSVSPVEGSTAGGTEVAITGTEFEAGASVYFGEAGEPAEAATGVSVLSSTGIAARAPAHATGAVKVCVKTRQAMGCTATTVFTYKVPVTLTVAGYGHGAVYSAVIQKGGPQPTTIEECEELSLERCGAELLEGDKVYLYAVTESGWDFAGWGYAGGDKCTRVPLNEVPVIPIPTPTSACVITLSANSEVNAAFVQKGEKGETGSTGATGPTGSTGETGATGSTGPEGAKGATGSEGAKGATGSEGAKGATGSEGAKGATGAQGATGLTGAEGKQGKTGAAGANGSQGITGPVGPTGLAGPVGLAGPQGKQGPEGKQGPAGKVELVVCHMVTRKKRSFEQCKTKLESGTVKFVVNAKTGRHNKKHGKAHGGSHGQTTVTQSLHVTLRRHGTVFAVGTALRSHRELKLRLLPLRGLLHGRYRLTLVSGGHGRKRHTQVTGIRLG